MKAKQAPREAAKHAVSAAKKGGARTAATPPVTSSTAASSTKSDFDDVASLFNAIKQKKAQRVGEAAPSHRTATSPKADGEASKKLGRGKPSHGNSGAAQASASATAAAKPIRDGLYRAPEKSVQMSDNQFFSGTWLKEDRNAAAAASAAASGESPEASEELLRKEGVDRIVSMEELTKMLSRSAKAGTTPNCPFDCDCCF